MTKLALKAEVMPKVVQRFQTDLAGNAPHCQELAEVTSLAISPREIMQGRLTSLLRNASQVFYGQRKPLKRNVNILQ